MAKFAVTWNSLNGYTIYHGIHNVGSLNFIKGDASYTTTGIIDVYNSDGVLVASDLYVETEEHADERRDHVYTFYIRGVLDTGIKINGERVVFQ